MRILRMTATFGKLDSATLNLETGLNVIYAPNEWGKSTWCAFLLAMLYGVETRSHSTKAALADKERYAPWSGKPMSGSIQLEWQGREITLERTTKGRVPMGEFRAFETESGLPVPELTAENCGQVLLGVEKSVFRQAGFINLRDMPVAGDEALRRRLNALVTTGDESGTGELLQQGLRELKNRCRANKTKGLLPQAMQEAQNASDKLSELRKLRQQEQSLRQRAEKLNAYRQALARHKRQLEYDKNRALEEKLETARQNAQRLSRQEAELSFACAAIPVPEELTRREQALVALREKIADVHKRLDALREPARDLDVALPPPSQAVLDERRYGRLLTAFVLLSLLGVLSATTGIVGLWWMPQWRFAALGVLALGAVLLLAGVAQLWRRYRLKRQYLPARPGQWVQASQAASQAAQERKRYDTDRTALERELAALEAQGSGLSGGCSLDSYEETLRACRAKWHALEEARSAHYTARELLHSLQSAVSQMAPPEGVDSLSLSMEETLAQIEECDRQTPLLHRQLGNCQARLEALGDEEVLEAALDSAKARVRALSRALEAIDLAQRTLQEAQEQLQRRFAPRITKRTRELFARLTADRYDRIALDEELRLRAAGDGEDALRPILFRSEGTVDQLYLALRLAVAEELTPEAPLVLDDALAHFDEARMGEALAILAQEAEHRQVILFTCHSREAALL